MCGRYTFTQLPAVELAETAVPFADWLRPRYNVAPTNYCPIFPMQAPERVHLYRWGLIPHWAKDEKIGYRMINARSETVAEKPAFRGALARGRCLVWADGFYEWQRQGKAKQPYRITLHDGGAFLMAGLCAQWQGPDGVVIPSFTILTTTPNALMAPIHDRMPVILSATAAQQWLAPDFLPVDLPALCAPYPAEAMRAYPVGAAVGNVRHDHPGLVAPI